MPRMSSDLVSARGGGGLSCLRGNQGWWHARAVPCRARADCTGPDRVVLATGAAQRARCGAGTRGRPDKAADPERSPWQPALRLFKEDQIKQGARQTTPKKAENDER